MLTTATAIHPNASTLPERTRMALAEAALVISGAIGPRLTTPASQWDKMAHTMTSFRDLREPQDYHSDYATKATAWAVYVQMVNALLVEV